MKKNTFLDKMIVGSCLAILFIFTFTIAARFLTRQILIKRFHMDNAFTRMVWFDNTEAAKTNVILDWEKQYPFGQDIPSSESRTGFPADEVSFTKRFSDKVFSVEEKIETYATDLLAGYYKWVGLAKTYNRWIGWVTIQSALPADDDSQVIHLDNGYLTYAEPLVADEDFAVIADSVAEFRDFLEEEGAGFYYINAGSKVCPYDRQMSASYQEFSNENGDRLIEALELRKVDTLDLRECMIRDGCDWYGSYYIADHHWKTEAGLWAAGVVSRFLNEKSGFDFDDFYFSESSYRFEKYENYFLGSQGRSLTLAEAALEDYTKITPLFETDFSVSIPTRGVECRGTYDEALFQGDDFWSIAEYTADDFLVKKDAYSCAGIGNDALAVIKNNSAKHNADKKILMLQDSFSWYSTSFLACDVGEIDVIYAPAFTGSIRAYIRQTQPDVVIMMLCERNINPMDAEDCEEHTAMFDLR